MIPRLVVGLGNDEKKSLQLRLKYSEEDWKLDGSLPETIVSDPTKAQWALPIPASCLGATPKSG